MIFIGVGSSIGEAQTQFTQAELDLKSKGVEVIKKSTLMVNPPQGGVAKNDFTNAVWHIEFPETKWEKANWCLLPASRRQKLKAYKLLKVLQWVEDQAHRTRSKRWEDRTLDLDILMFHQLILRQQRLLIPHPRIPERDFVLRPWEELVDKEFEIPKFGRVSELIKSLT
jgi:7,8-dihydro-6-hydroxymethylpterin-pyrophosphokinase